MIFLGIWTSHARAATVYLRPDGDLTKPASWLKVVGAETMWDALNDNVSEEVTPSAANYIRFAPGGPRTIELDLNSVAFGGSSIKSGAAWFYMADSGPLSIRVNDGPKTVGGPATFSSSGWHSVSISLSGAQSQINNLSARIEAPLGPERQVNALLIKLTLEGGQPKIYWGSWIDGEVYGEPFGDAPWDSATWELFKNHATKAPSIIHFGQPAPWNQKFDPVPLEKTSAKGAIPLMDMDSDGVSLQELEGGAHDADFHTWAKAVKAYGKPFFFRWMWEMNGSWYYYGSEAHSNPSRYVNVWRRIHDIAESEGATNITWVWCPNVIHPGSTSLSSLYPEDKEHPGYVDWTCMDGYNFGAGEWRSFEEVFAPTYSALSSLAPAKPMMIGETASAELSGSKSRWITDALVDQLPTTFPKIKAINWFNWNALEEGVRRTWPIESSDSAEAAFAAGVSSPLLASNSYGELPVLTRIQPLP